MPLGRYRQRREKPSSDDSLKDELYDQLLASLKQGGEPLPTDLEYWRWLQGRIQAHPGESIWYADERLPMPIRRSLALRLIGAFTEESWLGLQQAIHEDEAGPEELTEPLDVEQVRADWLQWRSETIQQYRLEGMVTQAEE